MSIIDQYGQEISEQEVYNRLLYKTEELLATNRELEQRIASLERTSHQLWRMFSPQIQFQQAIDFIEQMIENEDYTEAQENIRNLRRFFSNEPRLAGVEAHLHVTELLKKHKE